jgi:phage-related protein
MTAPAPIKPLLWVGSSKKDLLEMPADIQDLFGFALHQAQTGRKSDSAKPMQGFGSAGVLEIVEEWRSDAYRAIYTVKFANAIYVLHCFQK